MYRSTYKNIDSERLLNMVYHAHIKPGVVTALLVDDNYKSNESLSLYLKSNHVNCLTAFNSKEALEIVSENTEIQVLVLGVSLTGANGDALVQKVLACRPDIRIIILSAYNDEDLIVSYFNKGVHDYIQKPCSLLGLLNAINIQSKLFCLTKERLSSASKV